MENVHQTVSEQYRSARAELLAEEQRLREVTASVASLRAALPDGPAVDPGVPLTTASGKPVSLGSLFGRHHTLIAYHLVFDEGWASPRTTSAMWVDGLDPLVPHLADRTAVAVLSPASPGRLADLAGQRGWRHIPVVSTQPGDLTDRIGARADSGLVPALTCFRWEADGILRLHWQGLPGLADPAATDDSAGDGPGLDQFCATWALLDLLP